MAAGGSLAPVALLWLCLAPAALVRLWQPRPVLVVEPGEAVAIGCEASEDMESKGNVYWYRRGGGDGPVLVLHCQNVTNGGFSCKFGGHNVTLHITRAHPNHTGLYLCAYSRVSRLHLGSGTALLVGDSWRAGSWVRVLAPRGDPQTPPSPVCAVGATAGPVLVSWPGRPGEVLGLRGGVGPLTSAVGTAGAGGGLCEVRFNASGPPTRRSTDPCGATGGSFLTWVLAGVGALLLLSLCLGTHRLRRPTGRPPGTPEPPASQQREGELTYAQLSFAAPAGRAP